MQSSIRTRLQHEDGVVHHICLARVHGLTWVIVVASLTLQRDPDDLVVLARIARSLPTQLE